MADDQFGRNLAGLAPMAREQLLISLCLVDWRFDLGNGMCHGVKSSVVGDDLPERAPLFRDCCCSPSASTYAVVSEIQSECRCTRAQPRLRGCVIATGQEYDGSLGSLIVGNEIPDLIRKCRGLGA